MLLLNDLMVITPRLVHVMARPESESEHESESEKESNGKSKDKLVKPFLIFSIFHK